MLVLVLAWICLGLIAVCWLDHRDRLTFALFQHGRVEILGEFLPEISFAK